MIATEDDERAIRVMLASPYSLSTPGGVQGQVLGLARALQDLGVSARVIGPCDGPPPEPHVISVGPSTRVSSNGSIAPIATSNTVRARTLEALRSYRPDVVHLHEPFVPGPTLATLLGANVPIVGTFHAAFKSGRSRWYSALRPATRRVANEITIRTAVSESARSDAEAALGGTYLVVPNGVDRERFAGAVPWPKARPAILFVGRHEERKGLAVLLDAFEGLERDAELWVVGDGPETEEMEARGIPNVLWLGRVNDVELARRLRGATMFCAPSLYGESFGIVLLEAMSASVPVVASDIAGYRAVARPDVEAILVEPGDSSALRIALRRVLDEPATVERLVEAGNRRASEFSLHRLAERYLLIYQDAIDLFRAGVRE